MDAWNTIDWLREAFGLLLVVSLPVLATALVVGLVVSVLQAVTQVSDPTLSFVPKIIAVLLAVVITAPWMMDMIVEFSQRMFQLP